MQSKNKIRAGVRPQNPLKRSMCPWWYRQSSNPATIAFGMEIDVASCLDSAHGATLYAIGGKSCVRVCNLNQRSQRSDFEALVQAWRRTRSSDGSQSRSAREDPQGCGTTMMMGTGQERGCANHRASASPKAFTRRITESCSNGTIIVIIMNLFNFLFYIKISGTLGTGQVNPGVSRVEIYHNR